MKRFSIRFILNVVIASVIFLFSFGFTNKPGSQYIIHNGNLYYLANTIVIQLKDNPAGVMMKAQNLTAQLNSVYNQFKFTSAKTMFGSSPAEVKFGLNRMMLLHYSSNVDPLYASAKLKELNYIEWAEPKYVRRLTFQPNDPYFSSEYNLGIIQADSAWNISQGDTNVVIGIVDTGVDWPHPDLYANIWHNWNWQNDTQYQGDSIGWDFGGDGNGSAQTPDNNPIEDAPYHGTLVAGTADAVTNNGIGVAGIGFKCKIMAVKVTQKNQIDPSSGDPYVLYGFDGIKYAADHGARVINCSWGGGGYSNSEQEIIDYANSKGALIVAAAGNDGVNESFYPASYQHVLSVAATDQYDALAGFSNYGENIDVCAPGVGIYSTWQAGDSYTAGEGTSFSSPLAAGLAALVFSHFPNYTPDQVAEQIRVNCDNINSQNPGMQYLMGGGRINAYKALSNSNSESVRAENIHFSDAAPGGNGDGIFERGETITVTVDFTNYLNPINNLTVSLVSMDPAYATVVNGSFTKSGVPSLGTFDNSGSQFSFKLSNNTPLDATIQFRLDYSDGSYSDFQLFDVPVNPSYFTQSGNNVALTIASQGNVGFNDYPNNLEGDGFKYKNGNNFLFEGALIIGNSSTTIEDEARGSDQNYKDTSFSVVSPFKLSVPGGIADEQGIATFNDDGAGSSKLGISTRLQSYSYNAEPNNNFIILKYSFTNKSGSTISNFYAGLFTDWDMVEGSGTDDSAKYDYTGNFGYAMHNAANFDTLTAVALISSNNYCYWAILNDGSDGYFGIYDGFDNNEKWQAISSGIGKPSAGSGDISEVTSGGPYTINAGQTLDVAFAIAAGTSLDDLRNSISNARVKYQSIPTAVSDEKNEAPYTYDLMQNYPNPFNPVTTIKYQLAKQGHVTLRVYDMLGRLVETIVDAEKPAGNYEIQFPAGNLQLASGVYIYTMNVNGLTFSKKLLLMK